MKTPKVSIVCITYNQEKYIGETLESFVTQKTDFEFEAIIADDCSTDGTAKIIRQYAKKYPGIIKPTLRSKNVGVGNNLLGALTAAKGKYIALCEGDDFWTDPNKLQLQADFLDKNPSCAMVFHPVRVFFENNEEEESIYPQTKDTAVFTTEELLKTNFIQTNSVMYRGQNYKNLPTNILPLDWYLHLYHAQFGKIGFIDRVMSAYRRHPGGLWWDSYKDLDEIWKKYGINHVRLYAELLKIYGGNLGYKDIIDNHISGTISALNRVVKKNKANDKFARKKTQIESEIERILGLDQPLISVIITNYNYGGYVTEAINSILLQTYRNIELIIINDGSTDNSDEVIKRAIEKYPQRNIKYVSRKNMGVVYTRNEGMELAKGAYLSYLDADDYFNRDYISKSYKIAKDHIADVVYPNWHFVGEWLGRPDTNFPEFEPELLQLQKLHVTPASLIRKSAIKNHKFEVETVAEDWDFFIGLSLEGAKFKLAKDNCINYRIRKGTRGSKNDPKEDTKYFVEILKKYRAKYGNKVINPAKLASDRHPNMAAKILRMHLPRIVIESVKKNGLRTTTRKILGKLLSSNPIIWETIGYTRNQQFKRIVRTYNIETSPKTKLAVVVHLYYLDLWPIIRQRLRNIDIPYDLFVSVQLKDKDISLDRVNTFHKTTNILAFPNRGRDVLPFLLITKKIDEVKQYKYVLKIHSKKSLHRNDGNEWLVSLLSELIPTDITSIIKTLQKKDTGAIGPASHVVSLERYMGGNRDLIGSILRKTTDKKTIEQILYNQSRYPFFGGTMFWCRLDYLLPLLNANLTPADFNSERGQVDRTTAHAIERTLGKILHKVSNKKMYAVKKGAVNQLPEKSYKAKYKYVD